MKSPDSAISGRARRGSRSMHFRDSLSAVWLRFIAFSTRSLPDCTGRCRNGISLGFVGVRGDQRLGPCLSGGWWYSESACQFGQLRQAFLPASFARPDRPAGVVQPRAQALTFWPSKRDLARAGHRPEAHGFVDQIGLNGRAIFPHRAYKARRSRCRTCHSLPAPSGMRSAPEHAAFAARLRISRSRRHIGVGGASVQCAAAATIAGSR